MKINQINNSITAYFDDVANNADLVVRYQNDPRSTPADEIWCAASIDFGKSQQKTIGINSYKYNGNFNARIKEKAGLGLSNLLVIADIISSAFKVVNINNIKFRVPRIVNVGRVGDDHQINVICPFFADSSLNVIIDFYGSIVGTFSAGGELTGVYLSVLRVFDGISSAQSNLSGNLDSQPGLGSAITEISGVTGSLGDIEITIKLRGSVVGISEIRGGADSQPEFGSSIIEISGVAGSFGDIEVTTKLQGFIVGTLNVGGELTNIYLSILKALNGISATLGDLFGSLDSQPGLGSSAIEISGVAGSLGYLDVETLVLGTIAEVSDADGSLDRQQKLNGSIIGISGADGSMQRAIRRIIGSITGVSDAFSYLSGEWILIGSTAGVSGASGNLTNVTVEFIGSVIETSNVSGWLDRFKLLGIINAISNVSLLQGSITWETPLSVSDLYNKWVTEGYAIDEDTGSRAWYSFTVYGWGYTLEFTTPEVLCNKIQVLGYKSADDIEVRGNYYDGSWHQVGTILLPASKAWTEISLGGMQLITKFRLDFRTTKTINTAYLYEVEYNDIVIAGDLEVITGLIGSITGTLNVSGSLGMIYFAGSIAGVSSNSGSLDRQPELVGSTNSISNNFGSLNFTTINLSSSISVESTIIGRFAMGYVDRGDPAAADWNETGSKAILDTDGDWHELNCSSVVPAGAIAIQFAITVQDGSTGQILLIRENGNSNTYNVLESRTQVASISSKRCGIVACDGDRKCEYLGSNTAFTLARIVIMGWFI